MLIYLGGSEIENKDKSFSISLWNTLYFGIHIDAMKYCIAFSFSVQPIKLLLRKILSNGSIIHWPLSQNSLLWIILIPYNCSYKIWYLIFNSDRTKLCYIYYYAFSLWKHRIIMYLNILDYLSIKNGHTKIKMSVFANQLSTLSLCHGVHIL